VVAVIDARRGEVFAASPGVFEPVALTPAALAERLAPGTLAVGDGAVRFREELERAGAVVPVDGSPLHRVSAVEICRLGATGEPADRDHLLPDYRREPDAKPRPRPESFPQ
jgi:tRNA threonylcarbamoyladenosine biosynthesis protein TsaB